MGRIDGAVIVTTGQRVSVNDVRKEVNFCNKTGVEVIGVVENMSGYICRGCDKKMPLFGGGEHVAKMLKEYKLELLGELSFSREFLEVCEKGEDLFE